MELLMVASSTFFALLGDVAVSPNWQAASKTVVRAAGFEVSPQGAISERIQVLPRSIDWGSCDYWPGTRF
jgi:hypothetical protein